jgi:hypothetical protein
LPTITIQIQRLRFLENQKMTQNPTSAGRSTLSTTSKMSFGVAASAFAAAGIGLLINQWMSGWMAVGGMAGVGLFYMAIGLLNLSSSDSVFMDEDDLSETAAHRLSGVANVDDLAMERTREKVGETRSEHMANASH